MGRLLHAPGPAWDVITSLCEVVLWDPLLTPAAFLQRAAFKNATKPLSRVQQSAKVFAALFAEPLCKQTYTGSTQIRAVLNTDCFV